MLSYQVMFRDFYSPSSYIDNSYIQEKSYVCTTKVRNLYKNDQKVLISIYNVANLYLFSHQKQPLSLLHRMFKTYVLTNNIKVNTTKFLSMGLMKLATKNHGAGVR